MLYRKGKLSDEQIKELNELGIVWHNTNLIINRGWISLKKFVTENGHARVPAIYKDADGFNLGSWVITRRREYGPVFPSSRYNPTT